MMAKGRTDAEVLQCLRWARCSPEVLDESGKADLEVCVIQAVPCLFS
jgi:hypothetical protein